MDYVLLGADTEFLPVRYARSTFYPAGSYTDIPTDHYYACLDGNWNADGDGLFGEQMGFRVIETDYEFPAVVFAAENPPLGQQPAFLNVRLYGEKLSPTPKDYLYEWDVQPEATPPGD